MFRINYMHRKNRSKIRESLPYRIYLKISDNIKLTDIFLYINIIKLLQTGN